MPLNRAMGSSVAQTATGSHREKGSHPIPGRDQIDLNLPDPQEIQNITADGYEVLREVVAIFGGQKKLAVHLGEKITYNTKINEGLTRTADRSVQFDWLIPLLKHEHAAMRLLSWMNNVAQMKPPEPVVTVTDEERARILAAELTPERKRKLEREHGLPAGSLG